MSLTDSELGVGDGPAAAGPVGLELDAAVLVKLLLLELLLARSAAARALLLDVGRLKVLRLRGGGPVDPPPLYSLVDLSGVGVRVLQRVVAAVHRAEKDVGRAAAGAAADELLLEPLPALVVHV
jgi:hypothetical protein